MLQTNVDRIIELLKANKHMSVGEIAKELKTSNASVQQFAEYLEEEKLVKLDYKLMKPILTLTEKGKAQDTKPIQDDDKILQINQAVMDNEIKTVSNEEKGKFSALDQNEVSETQFTTEIDTELAGRIQTRMGQSQNQQPVQQVQYAQAYPEEEYDEEAYPRENDQFPENYPEEVNPGQQETYPQSYPDEEYNQEAYPREDSDPVSPSDEYFESSSEDFGGETVLDVDNMIANCLDLIGMNQFDQAHQLYEQIYRIFNQIQLEETERCALKEKIHNLYDQLKGNYLY